MTNFEDKVKDGAASIEAMLQNEQALDALWKAAGIKSRSWSLSAHRLELMSTVQDMIANERQLRAVHS